MIGRITWRGLSLGTGTRYGITALEGWEDYEATDGSEGRGADDDELLGPLVLAGRTVTVEGYVYDPGARDGLVLALQAATPKLNALDELVVEQFGRTLVAEARVVRRSLPQGRRYGSGWQPWAVQWRAPSARRYGLSAGDVAVGLPLASGGVTLPQALPVALGAAASTGRVRVPNDGAADYAPTLAITGPTPNGFEVTHLETGRRQRYVGALPAGEVLTINNRRRRVRLAGGTDRRGDLTIAQWFTVPPGGATFAWTSLGPDYSPDAELAVLAPPSGAHW